jgi:hypothetical protein
MMNTCVIYNNSLVDYYLLAASILFLDIILQSPIVPVLYTYSLLYTCSSLSDTRVIYRIAFQQLAN